MCAEMIQAREEIADLRKHLTRLDLPFQGHLNWEPAR